MLKLWGEVRGVMGRGGDKCGVAVLGIWGSRKWVAGECGTPSEIRGVYGCAAPDGTWRSGRRARFVTSEAARRLQTPCAICVDRGRMAPRAPSTIRGIRNMPCGGFLFERYTFT